MAQELELKVDSSKYQARITQLENYVSQLEGIVEEYTTMKTRVNEFMADTDDNYELMQQNVENRIARVRKAIEATQSQINTLKDILNNMQNVGSNVSTILKEGLSSAAAGLFE